MLEQSGVPSLDALIDRAVPKSIRSKAPLDLPPSRAERDVLGELRRMAGRNRLLKSLIGAGYYDTFTPRAILRNVMEGPGWYTAYTPYQPEISQGRLEAVPNYQTTVIDRTGKEMPDYTTRERE